MLNDSSFKRPELFVRRSPVESLERRLHQIDNLITEGMILFMRSAKSVFPVGIADAEADVFIGHEGGAPLYVSTLSGIVP